MLDDNPLFPRPSAVPSTYASMAAFTAAANMYNSFYPSGSMPIDSASSFACSELKRERLDPKVTVKLEDADLWKRFCAIGNEMIITKNGRRLFPNFRVSVSGLEPTTKYVVFLDIAPLDEHRYKYQESVWIISGKAEPHLYGRYYIHPDSPQTGAQWMKQSILFNKVKVTNSPMQNSNQILLNSMHRYIPRLHIVQASDQYGIRTGPLSTFIFDETAFIAVTAYQNDQITKLKINNNPFAKGFRETTSGKKNNTKAVKRLQTPAPEEKPTKLDENPHRLYKSDSSLLSTTSSSSPLNNPIADSTTGTYVENEHNSDMAMNPMNFSSVYSSNAFYPTYPPDRSSMIYNPSYGYMGSTSTSMPTTSSPLPFVPYGCYPTNNYHTSFF